MFKFTDYIDPMAFFIAFFVGMFFTYIYQPNKKIIIKWPTPENVGTIIYKDYADNCYKYKSNEIPCPDDKTQIKTHNLEHSD